MQSQNKVVEYNLEASEFNWEIAPGKQVTAWGFNNQVPGPSLKANKGDTLVVKVKNNLKEPTMVHWHGIRLPASMDGTGEVQQPILPGEEFEYRFTVPDAGTFWYHSHHNETVQMERGMYGSLIIKDESDPVVDRERVFMIDDMKLTPANTFKKHGAIGRWIERHDGREGDTLLINGKENPVIDIAAGQMERWRFINSSSARYFLLHLGGKPFDIMGTDGGLLEGPQRVTEILITPGERVDIIAGPFNEGDVFPIESLRYNRTTFLKPKRQQFAMMQVGKALPSIAYIPRTFRKIEPLAPKDAAITRKVKLSVDPSLKNIIDFNVNNDVRINDKPVNW